MKSLSSEAQALIARTRQLDEPTLGDRARLRERLDTNWAAATTPAVATTPAATTTTAGATSTTATVAPQLGMALLQGKLLLSATSFVAVAAAGLWLATSSPAPAVQPATRPSVESPLTAASAARAVTSPAPKLYSQRLFAPEPQPAFVPTPGSEPARPSWSAQAFASPQVSTATPAGARARLAKPQRSSASRRLGNTSTRAQRHDDLSAPGETPEARSSEQQAPTPAQRKLVPAEAAAFVPDAIADEVTLLGAAQRELRAGRPSRALGYIQQHAIRFPTGALAQERAAAQALALCALNRKAAARQVFEDLARRAPSAAVLPRIRHDCDF